MTNAIPNGHYFFLNTTGIYTGYKALEYGAKALFKMTPLKERMQNLAKATFFAAASYILLDMNRQVGRLAQSLDESNSLNDQCDSLYKSTLRNLNECQEDCGAAKSQLKLYESIANLNSNKFQECQTFLNKNVTALINCQEQQEATEEKIKVNDNSLKNCQKNLEEAQHLAEAFASNMADCTNEKNDLSKQLEDCKASKN